MAGPCCQEPTEGPPNVRCARHVSVVIRSVCASQANMANFSGFGFHNIDVSDAPIHVHGAVGAVLMLDCLNSCYLQLGRVATGL